MSFGILPNTRVNTLVAGNTFTQNLFAQNFTALNANFPFQTGTQVKKKADVVNGVLDLTESGSYIIGSNIVGKIVLSEDNICLNLNCFEVDATGQDHGIEAVGRRNVTILNGLVRNASEANVFFRDCEQCIMDRLRLTGHIQNGLHCIDCNGGFWTNIDVDGSNPDGSGAAYSERGILCVSCTNCTHIYCTVRKHNMTVMNPAGYDYRLGTGTPLTFPYQTGGIVLCASCTNMKCDTVSFNENERNLVSAIITTIPTGLLNPSLAAVPSPGAICSCYSCMDCYCNNCEHNQNQRIDNVAADFTVLFCVNSHNFICTNCRRNENVDKATVADRGSFYVCYRLSSSGCIDSLCQTNENIVENPLRGNATFGGRVAIDFCFNVNGIMCQSLQCVNNKAQLSAVVGALSSPIDPTLGIVAQTQFIGCGALYSNGCMVENCQIFNLELTEVVRANADDSLCGVYAMLCAGTVGINCRKSMIKKIFYSGTGSGDGVYQAGCYYDIGGAATELDGMFVDDIGGFYDGATISWFGFKGEFAVGIGGLCPNVYVKNSTIIETFGKSMSLGVGLGGGSIVLENVKCVNTNNSSIPSPTLGAVMPDPLTASFWVNASSVQLKNCYSEANTLFLNKEAFSGSPPNITGPFVGNVYNTLIGKNSQESFSGTLPPYLGVNPFESSQFSGLLSFLGAPVQSKSVLIDNCNFSGFNNDLSQYGNSWSQFFAGPPANEELYYSDKNTGIKIYKQNNVVIKNTQISGMRSFSAASGFSYGVHIFESNNVTIENCQIQDVVGIDACDASGIFLEGVEKHCVKDNCIEKINKSTLVSTPSGGNPTVMTEVPGLASILGAIYLKDSPTPIACSRGTIENNELQDGSGAAVLVEDGTNQVVLKNNKVIAFPKGFEDTVAVRSTSYLANYVQDVPGASEYLITDGTSDIITYTIKTGAYSGAVTPYTNLIAV